MKKWLIFSAIGLLCSILGGCRNERTHPVQFYYWKSEVNIGRIEQQYFDSLGCKRLYIRLFDVDTQNGRPTMMGKIARFNAATLSAEYVPVVYITNRTFSNLSDDGINDLSQNIQNLIQNIAKTNRFPEIHEINIDCDWTASTKSAYFKFLKTLHEQSNKDISCTLRLHQIKYREQSGIPPVCKGYLMCYATTNPTDTTTANSILDIALLKNYTQNINDYPLTFDVALPLYSWGIVTNHLGEIKLINGLTADELQPPSFEKKNNTTYEVMQDCFLHGLYIDKGLTIRLEGISPELLTEAKQYLDQKMDIDYNIVYFHLSQEFLKRFTIKNLQ